MAEAATHVELLTRGYFCTPAGKRNEVQKIAAFMTFVVIAKIIPAENTSTHYINATVLQ